MCKQWKGLCSPDIFDTANHFWSPAKTRQPSCQALFKLCSPICGSTGEDLDYLNYLNYLNHRTYLNNSNGHDINYSNYLNNINKANSQELKCLQMFYLFK